MTNIKFEEVQALFQDVDEWGSLRDIYVFGVGDTDWQEFIDELRKSAYQFAYSVDDQEMPLPNDVHEIFDEGARATTRLAIDVASMSVHCHFFGYDELELDVWSEEVDRQERLDALLVFLAWIGRSLKRDAILTPEEARDYPFFRYYAQADRVERISR